MSESEVVERAERAERGVGAGVLALWAWSSGSEVCDAGFEGHGAERRVGLEMRGSRLGLRGGAGGGHFGRVPWKRSRLDQITRARWRKLYLVSRVYSIGF